MWHNTDYPTEPYGKRGLYIFQPLKTDAPATAQPYCYLLDRIAFYEQPYRTLPDGNYAKHDELQTEWNLLGQRWTEEQIGWAALAPFVMCAGVLYELSYGDVIRSAGRWWKRWLAWKVPADDRRVLWMREHSPSVLEGTPQHAQEGP